jgi:glycosyltransferase involved in cell wall biosynthesis
MGPVAYLTGTFPTWSETFIAREVRLLRAAGLPLIMLALRQGDAPLGDLPAPFVPSAAAAAPRPATGPGQRFAARLPAPLLRALTEWRYRATIRQLAAHLREAGASHVHAAFADLPGLLAAAVARELGCTWSISLHAADAMSLKYGAGALADAAFLAICNRNVYQHFRLLHPPLAPRTYLLPHGLPLADWPPRPQPWAPHDPVRILFVGRLVPKKQPEVAVAAVTRLRDRGIPAELTMIGAGTAALPAAPWLHLRGAQPEAVVRQAMAEADLLLLASTELPGGDREGLPNVVLEAMASGLPVVAPLTGSIGEALSPATGFPAIAATAAPLADALAQALADPAATAARLAAARQLVVSHYDAERCIQPRLALLRQAADS